MTREKPYIELQDAENDAYYDNKERLEKALKPCPFCGRPGQFDNVGTQTFWVRCPSIVEDDDYCGISGRPGSNIEEAAKYWNRRTDADCSHKEELVAIKEAVNRLVEIVGWDG